MIKSSTEAAAIPTFHYMDEVHVDGLLAVRQLLKNDPLLQGKYKLKHCAVLQSANRHNFVSGKCWRRAVSAADSARGLGQLDPQACSVVSL